MTKDGNKVDFGIEPLDGVKLVSDDDFKQVINNVWKSTVTVVGRGEIPLKYNGGKVIRKASYLKLSCRLPPTLDAEEAEKRVVEYFNKR